MNPSDMIRSRLVNQQIAGTAFKTPQELVGWMIAMQAQDFAMAKWAIGLRLPGLKDADVEKAFNEGAILRTHLMRPTWHFVAPADIRWMLSLTKPRVHAANAYSYRQQGLDDAVLNRSRSVLEKVLQGGRHLTRTALKTALEQEGIIAEKIRLSYIMMWAELEGIICSGPREGKQFTYALLEERVPAVRALEREEALAAFLQRYVASRGPATLKDFTYWSGLTMKDAREGIALLGDALAHEKIAGQENYYGPDTPVFPANPQTTFLMPDYDEYGMSYRNRDILYKSESGGTDSPVFNTAYFHLFVLDGRFGGTWEKEAVGKNTAIKTTPSGALNAEEQQALDEAVNRYRAFTA